MAQSHIHFEKLSSEQLAHELKYRGTTVRCSDAKEDMVKTLRGILALDDEFIDFEQNFSVVEEIQQCHFALCETENLLKLNFNQDLIDTLIAKFWHLEGRIERLIPVNDEQLRIKCSLECVVRDLTKIFETKAQFFRDDSHRITSSPIPANNNSYNNNTSSTTDITSALRSLIVDPDYVAVSQWDIKFSGLEKDPLAVLKFIRSVDEYLTLKGVSERRLLASFKSLLRDEALVWYRNCLEDRVSSWRELQSELKTEFLPVDFSRKALENLKQYKQLDNESITRFIAHFEEEAGWLTQPLSEAEKLELIKKNISVKYQEKLWDKDISSKEQLINLCRKIDATFDCIKHLESSSSYRSGDLERPFTRSDIRNTPVKSASPPRTSSANSREIKKQSSNGNKIDLDVRLKCFNCGKLGHTSKQCPTVRCWGCGAQGRIKANCRNCQGN